MNKQNNPDMVICPACVHEFPGIPENVQAELIGLRTALAAKDAEIARLKGALKSLRPRLEAVATGLSARPTIVEAECLYDEADALVQVTDATLADTAPETCVWRIEDGRYCDQHVASALHPCGAVGCTAMIPAGERLCQKHKK